MFHSRKLNNRINSLHERCLRFIYVDYISSFEELLKKDGTVSTHVRNLQFLAIEMFKIKNEIAPVTTKEFFPRKVQVVARRYPTDFQSRKINTVHHGEGSLSFLGPKIWSLVPEAIKASKSLSVFKKRIKS